MTVLGTGEVIAHGHVAQNQTSETGKVTGLQKSKTETQGSLSPGLDASITSSRQKQPAPSSPSNLTSCHVGEGIPMTLVMHTHHLPDLLQAHK